MINNKQIRMRDVFIERVYRSMKKGNIFFLSDDFGAPVLDKLREDFPDRFINIGIAEQNLINISTGLALEGFTVYVYAIAAFLTMRAYEQIRVLAMLSQFKELNVNLIGVGAGLSYDVSGPSHHCLEDLGIMRMLPNLTVFSPSDWILAENFVDYTLKNKGLKYIRLDGKLLDSLYNKDQDIKTEEGFFELGQGDKLCIVSTGYMTHKALKIRELLIKENINIGVIDTFLLKPFSEDKFFKALGRYKLVVTLEEGFINNGGLDGLAAAILDKRDSQIRLKRLGFDDTYTFDIGDRQHLHKLNNLDEESIIKNIKGMLRQT